MMVAKEAEVVAKGVLNGGNNVVIPIDTYRVKLI
jgi:hypothetical protein